MTYNEAKEIEGKYGQLEFYLHSRKADFPTYYELFGTISVVEKRNLLFTCNHKHDFIVALKDIRKFTNVK